MLNHHEEKSWARGPTDLKRQTSPHSNPVAEEFRSQENGFGAWRPTAESVLQCPINSWIKKPIMMDGYTVIKSIEWSVMTNIDDIEIWLDLSAYQ